MESSNEIIQNNQIINKIKPYFDKFKIKYYLKTPEEELIKQEISKLEQELSKQQIKEKPTQNSCFFSCSSNSKKKKTTIQNNKTTLQNNIETFSNHFIAKLQENSKKFVNFSIKIGEEKIDLSNLSKNPKFKEIIGNIYIANALNSYQKLSLNEEEIKNLASNFFAKKANSPIEIDKKSSFFGFFTTKTKTLNIENLKQSLNI
jgi:hypothetical protein